MLKETGGILFQWIIKLLLYYIILYYYIIINYSLLPTETSICTFKFWLKKEEQNSWNEKFCESNVFVNNLFQSSEMLREEIVALHP